VFAGKKITLVFFNNELFVCAVQLSNKKIIFRFNSVSHLTNQSLKMTLVI